MKLSAIDQLNAYVKANPLLNFFEPSRISDDPEIQDDITEYFEELVSSGEAQIAYRVQHPDGYLLAGQYTTPADIPERVFNRLCTYMIETSECTIVTGYIEAED